MEAPAFLFVQAITAAAVRAVLLSLTRYFHEGEQNQHAAGRLRCLKRLFFQKFSDNWTINKTVYNNIFIA
jgi:hypothetical protein